jgi:hypothetical protein
MSDFASRIRRAIVVASVVLLAGVGLSAPARAAQDCATYWSPGGSWSGAPAPGGTGSELDPFQVGSAADLDQVRQCVLMNFQQVADIDLSAMAPWVPIDTGLGFRGSYDGQGHQISGLTLTDAAGPADAAGLFGLITCATVRNLRVVGASVPGTCRMGAGRVGGLTKSTQCGQQLLDRPRDRAGCRGPGDYRQDGFRKGWSGASRGTGAGPCDCDLFVLGH